VGTSFLTGRPSCLFCEFQIAPIVAQQSEASGEMCHSCGAELVAPFRFCKRCGTAQPPAQTDEIDPEFVDEEPTAEETLKNIYRNRSMMNRPNSKSTDSSSWDYSAAPVPLKARTPWLMGGAAALLSVAILIAWL
jgi:hypothetical protein